MTFEALITEHRDHRPGYDFIGHYEAAIPLYEMQIKVEVLRSVEMSTMAQFVTADPCWYSNRAADGGSAGSCS